MQPSGQTVSVITHDHRDHFAGERFLARADWRVIGPPSVVGALPASRVIAGDSAAVGALQGAIS